MKINFPTLTLLIFILSCKSQDPTETTNIKKDYQLILDEGIYIEKFDSTNTSENRYTADNQIYKEGKKLIYDYYYEDLEGRRFKFEEVEGAEKLSGQEQQKAWSFVSTDSLTERTIDKVEQTVIYGFGPMINTGSEYSQTVISFKYLTEIGYSNFGSSTGIIENEKNIWSHPPRDKFFQILEINPFPFIQAPYEIGNKWKWSLQIGSFWGDERWKTWEGSIINNYEYEIVDKKTINTKVGEIECYEIHSTAESSIGKTHLTAYFNMDIGFVKLDYTNIDSTKTVLELVQF